MASNPHAAPPDRSESGTARLTDERSLAAAINEDVQLREHDPAGPQAFDLERARLNALLPATRLAVEHIGSTAMAGLLAKPILGVMAGLASLEGVDTLIDRLCDDGCTTSGEFNATLTDRKWLMRWRAQARDRGCRAATSHG